MKNKIKTRIGSICLDELEGDAESAPDRLRHAIEAYTDKSLEDLVLEIYNEGGYYDTPDTKYLGIYSIRLETDSEYKKRQLEEERHAASDKAYELAQLKKLKEKYE